MKKYKIASGKTIAEISERVNKYIKTGWIPIGGISNSIRGFHQGMIKE